MREIKKNFPNGLLEHPIFWILPLNSEKIKPSDETEIQSKRSPWKFVSNRCSFDLSPRICIEIRTPQSRLPWFQLSSTSQWAISVILLMLKSDWFGTDRQTFWIFRVNFSHITLSFRKGNNILIIYIA